MEKCSLKMERFYFNNLWNRVSLKVIHSRDAIFKGIISSLNNRKPKESEEKGDKMVEIQFGRQEGEDLDGNSKDEGFHTSLLRRSTREIQLLEIYLLADFHPIFSFFCH